MTGFIGEEASSIEDAIDRIGSYWTANGRLPLTSDGSELIGDIDDPWGNPLRYLLKNRVSFIVASEGPDATWQSQFDIRAEVEVTSRTSEQKTEDAARSGSSDLLSWAHPQQTWLERRKAELGMETSDPSKNSDGGAVDLDTDDAFSHSVRWDVGGGETLSGAGYFWFFTWVMLGTAILFVPVGWLYRPHTYLQEEQEADD